MLLVARDLQRSAQVLQGVVAGLTLDGHLADRDVVTLCEWLQLHENVATRVPFAEVSSLLREALADEVVDDDERDLLLDWCQNFQDDDAVGCVCLTHATRRLHGLLHAVVADGRVTATELRDLRDWLLDYEAFREAWPFCDVWEALEQVLADGHVSAAEERALLSFFGDFAERPAEGPWFDPDVPGKPWLTTGAPHLQTLAGICADAPRIVFRERRFCFTGKACSASREELQRRVRERGGIPAGAVSRTLDYLVIGGASSPLWAYSSYGRKVELVLEYRRDGADIVIVREDDLVASF